MGKVPVFASTYLTRYVTRNLTSWAQNGVLLLIHALTVRAHEANSHSDQGWEKFTEKIIEVVCMYGGANLNKTGVSKGVVFLAWGAPAAKRVAKVDKVIPDYSARIRY